MLENERLSVFSFILKSLTRFCNLKPSSLANLANPGFVRIALSKKGVSMQYFLVQCGLTVLFTLLRWMFIWTKATEDNFSWLIVNNLFFVAVFSWLFTLGYYVKHRMGENLREQLDVERRNVRVSESNYYEMKKKLNAKNDELSKEKERFFTLIEKMVDAASVKKAFFNVDHSDQDVVAKERAAMSNFI